MDVQIALIGAMQAIVVAIIAGLFKRNERKQQEHADKAERYDRQHQQEALQTMKVLSADLALTIATAIAVRDGNGQHNGAINAALDKATEAGKAFESFIQEAAARHLHH